MCRGVLSAPSQRSATTSDALRPWRQATRIAVASRCPERFCLAASMSRSTCLSLRYSRLRLPTLTLTCSRSRAFSMQIALPPSVLLQNLGRVTEPGRPPNFCAEGQLVPPALLNRRRLTQPPKGARNAPGSCWMRLPPVHPRMAAGRDRRPGMTAPPRHVYTLRCSSTHGRCCPDPLRCPP
jgi:hypothetical protein